MIIREIVKYDGDIIFDDTKRDGTPRKLMNIDLLKKLGWEAKVSLNEGLRKTYEDYLLNEKVYHCKGR